MGENKRMEVLMPDKSDYQWMVDLIARHTTGAKWIRILKMGETLVTVGVRAPERCEDSKQVADREAFLASLHPDIWQARLMRADADGETYHIQFSVPRQLSFT
jgi:hypothetical protein